MITITPAQSSESFEHFITLAQEYVTWMVAEIQQHYPELNLAEFTAEHEYDNIRKKFPGDHVPPAGCLLIAMNDNQAAGCIAVGKLSDTIGEVRTLFVRPEFRGAGVGRKLVEAALGEAHHLGYAVVRLDTLGFMAGAQNLYRSYGFVDIEPYLDVSDSLKQYIHFLELHLS